MLTTTTRKNKETPKIGKITFVCQNNAIEFSKNSHLTQICDRKFSSKKKVSHMLSLTKVLTFPSHSFVEENEMKKEEIHLQNIDYRFILKNSFRISLNFHKCSLLLPVTHHKKLYEKSFTMNGVSGGGVGGYGRFKVKLFLHSNRNLF